MHHARARLQPLLPAIQQWMPLALLQGETLVKQPINVLQLL
jgi:hypothetical protein